MTRRFRTLFQFMILALLVAMPAVAQTPSPITVTTDGRVLTITSKDAYDSLTLRVATPDGQVFESEGYGGPVTFAPFANSRYTPPDGSYTWEIQLTPRSAIRPEVIEQARKERESGDAKAEGDLRFALHRAVVTRSGGFSILGGKMLAGQGREPVRRRPRVSKASVTGAAFFDGGQGRDPSLRLIDDVIGDDLIVQGSACVGLDCVNNENFGFDTLRLKENNLRILFQDTSTASGFPTTDWQLTANESASGGLNKFSIEDITGAKTPFTTEGGAPTNSLYVNSAGHVGLHTAVPLLDLDVSSGNTPAFRLAQNTSGGFSAQTWDIGANEANWFVRDVTGGSRLPLRIRPGAPTSSIDISSSGNVGIGTASPTSIWTPTLHIKGIYAGIALTSTESGGTFSIGSNYDAGVRKFAIYDETAPAYRFVIDNNGNVGIGTTSPGFPIEAASGAHLTVGGVWTNASSRAVKENIQSLTADEARVALTGLTPVKFAYRADPTERHVGFIAEDVPDLVATADRKGLSPMDVVAVLTRVLQEQQQTAQAQQQQIEELAAKLAALEARSSR